MRPAWWLTKDGDSDLLALYRRHYSARTGQRLAQFVGPGEHLVLRTAEADAMFVWRRFIDDSGQVGVNCSVFRNESAHRSSELVRQADAIADFCWPGLRHYTFVRAEAIRSSNPGFCFQCAGWRKCGMTKGGLVVLGKAPSRCGGGEVKMARFESGRALTERPRTMLVAWKTGSLPVSVTSEAATMCSMPHFRGLLDGGTTMNRIKGLMVALVFVILAIAVSTAWAAECSPSNQTTCANSCQDFAATYNSAFGPTYGYVHVTHSHPSCTNNSSYGELTSCTCEFANDSAVWVGAAPTYVNGMQIVYDDVQTLDDLICNPDTETCE